MPWTSEMTLTRNISMRKLITVLNHVNKCISLDMESCTWSRPLVDHINSESWTSPRRVVQKFHVHFIGTVYESMSKEIQSLLSWMCQRVLKFAHPLLILLSAKHRVAYRNFLWECEECMWNSFPHSHESFAGMCWKCTMAWRVLNSAWCWIYFLFLLVLIFSWHCADTDTVYLPKSKFCPK